MKFQNMGTFDGGTVVSSLASAAAPQRFQTMDAAAIANGGAFLSSELEKRDNTIRQPLTSFTYGRDIPVRVGGGWAEFVSAMNVDYGVTGGSEDGPVHAGGANGIPMVQANFDKGLFKTHVFSVGMRIMWVDMQREKLTGRSLESILRDGIRMTYDKHMDANTYVGIKRYGSTGLINNPNVVTANAAGSGAGSSTKFKDKTPDQILQDINDAILAVWAEAEYDRDAVPNHIIMPYEQINYLATTKVTELAEKTILQFLLDNNVAKTNGSDLYIGGCSWCKGAGAGRADRMVVYLNKERYLAMDELAPLSRAMTQPNAENVCYDTAFMANISEAQMYYENIMRYVDGI
ncbi:DUF2184 domain-containing protein [Enterocloster lavalensis]|jgi:hypothetical protein|uniref:DUF2184 domain-containing protein n=1 Tax=Enterocloster lavalensis TaxID=460384 RepID=UPI002047B7BF|nr:DUF2184 domain-containing protein [Enterocloster lavalensis]DAL37799.1 MAG TPA_asm: major capsid protein [Caudoviricetes sp.]